MDKETLKEWVKPYKDNSSHPYYRPFIAHDDQKKYNVFLVGINPATPIYSHEIDLDKYVELLTDYEEFHKKYDEIRINQGKLKMSRTRIGITSFVDEIEKRTGESTLETNVNSYPTKNKKELKKVESEIINHGFRLFYEVLMDHSPQVIIVHSKKGIEDLVKVLYKYNIIDEQLFCKESVSEMESSKEPFIKLDYQNGKKGAVFVCRHLMLHGYSGSSFSAFKDKVAAYLKDC
ncbi:hypothetical protein [Corticicoccus populi]|uniref:Uncharacterized protein n=1 Tax=Corticicoccus populi TaxID=1812821 RepID=A0ABW5WYD7_9STAP